MTTSILIAILIAVLNLLAHGYKEREKKRKAAEHEAARRGLTGHVNAEQRGESVRQVEPPPPVVAAHSQSLEEVAKQVLQRLEPSVQALRQAQQQIQQQVAKPAKQRQRGKKQRAQQIQRAAQAQAKPSSASRAASASPIPPIPSASARAPWAPRAEASSRGVASTALPDRGTMSSLVRGLGTPIGEAASRSSARVAGMTAGGATPWSKADLQRGFVVAQVLGAPRALNPWRAPAHG